MLPEFVTTWTGKWTCMWLIGRSSLPRYRFRPKDMQFALVQEHFCWAPVVPSSTATKQEHPVLLLFWTHMSLAQKNNKRSPEGLFCMRDCPKLLEAGCYWLPKLRGSSGSTQPSLPSPHSVDTKVVSLTSAGQEELEFLPLGSYLSLY